MSDVINLCPYCLAELPDDYPFDHVAIDYALEGRPQAFTGIRDREERREVIRVGRARGLSDYVIAVRISRAEHFIRSLMDEEEARGGPGRTYRRQHDEAIRQLWTTGMSDRCIARRLRIAHKTVASARRRQSLPPRYTNSAFVKQGAAA